MKTNTPEYRDMVKRANIYNEARKALTSLMQVQKNVEVIHKNALLPIDTDITITMRSELMAVEMRLENLVRKYEPNKIEP